KNVIVLSESYAEKYFGSKNPVGKTLYVNVEKIYEVAGVVKDPPRNSDFPLHIIIPIAGPRQTPGWGSVSSAVQCFIRVPDNFNVQSFENSLQQFMKKYMEPEDYENKTMTLQSMEEIHFNNNYSNITNTIFTKDKITTLSLVGILLLVISCINFINLKTALTSIYFKEIGIRKVLGSSRLQIALRFFGETFLLVVFSIVISLVLLEIFLPQLEFFTGYSLALTQIGSLNIFLFLLAVAVVTSLLAGLYPSLFISSLQPGKALRANINTSTGSIPVRKVLVIFQFVVSEVLIIGTLVVYNQLNYLQNVDMGFDKTSVLEISLPDNEESIIKRFKEQLLASSSIENISYSNTGTASPNTWSGDASILDRSQNLKFNSQIKFTDEDFFDTYKIELLAGENFNKNSTDTTYVINQTFVERMGLKNDYLSAIGTYVSIWGRKGRIIGVVIDFNTTSLVDKVSPVLITNYRKLYNLAGIRINTVDIKSTVEYVENVFEKVYPDFVIDYEFLDKTIEQFYEDEILFSRLMITF
ncbi:MAG TPA: ABC transporter permease, partial [Gillisia sp.]|nr:ABC transporter permease [Gillisia sp.]